jgi:L-amino acid N-acyltransferase YncA
VATFETMPRTREKVLRWFDQGFPVVVAEDAGDEVIAWASAPPYRPDRGVCGRVAEFSVYVARDHRGRGAGRTAMELLIETCERAGLWKLLSRIFPENEASLSLCRDLGFREFGTYRRHGKLGRRVAWLRHRRTSVGRGGGVGVKAGRILSHWPVESCSTRARC